MRATVEKHHGSLILPTIQATIAAGENSVGIRISDQGRHLDHPLITFFSHEAGGGLLTPQNPINIPSDLFSFSHVRNATRMEVSRLGALRTVSSSEQGIRATVGEQVDRWQQTKDHVEPDTNGPEEEAGVGPHPRIGIGLPMSNIFAT